MNRKLPIKTTASHGTVYWTLNGKIHRSDGPTVEYADGSKYWYLNGKIHREDGPAIEHASGTKAWYISDRHIKTVFGVK